MWESLRKDKHWIEYPFGTLFYRSLVRKLKDIDLHPNWYTFTFIFLGVTSGVLLAKNHVVLSYILWRMSIIMDLVDGPVARYKKKSSKFGEYLDNIGHVFSVLALSVGGCYGVFSENERHIAALSVACMVLLVYTLKYIDYTVITERNKIRLTTNGMMLFIEKRISDFLDIEIVFLFFLYPHPVLLIYLIAKVLRAFLIIKKSVEKLKNK